MADDLSLLMALRVQGVTTPERAASALCVNVDDAASRLRSLVEGGLAAERTGRVAGFTLTPQGSERLNELLATEGLGASETLKDSYERFLGVNQRVLRVCSDWQVRRDAGIETPNDHSDPDYDASVIDRLVELHEGACVCLGSMAECAHRFASYAARLDACVNRLREGDRAAFTAPLAESYHTVWFELHQDLLQTLGLERET